ncbi:MAG: hypothetical protein ACYDHW_07120 [Syntrophorhabdaceae bacterium]
MMSLLLVKLLLLEYLIIAVVAVCHKQWALVAYFAGSAVLTVGVIWMRAG